MPKISIQITGPNLDKASVKLTDAGFIHAGPLVRGTDSNADVHNVLLLSVDAAKADAEVDRARELLPGYNVKLLRD